jgi:hypothetical protein
MNVVEQKSLQSLDFRNALEDRKHTKTFLHSAGRGFESLSAHRLTRVYSDIGEVSN